MKKRRGRLRRLLTVVTALVVAVLVAAYAMISSLDVQQLAGLAKREVKAATGRDLAVDGPASLRVSLVPSIDLQDLRLANAPWGSRPDMATLDRLEVEVALLPLLWGEVVVKRLVAVEPDILLETDAQGRGNWEFETAAPIPETAPAVDEPDSVTVPDVQAFRIEGGQLTVRDAASGEVLQLAVGQVVGSVPAGGGQRNLLFEAAYNGNPFSVEGSYPGLAALLSGASAPLDLTFIAGGTTVTAKGQAGDLTGDWTADLAVTAEGESLAGLSPFVGSELPALGPFELTSEFKGGNQIIELNGLRLVVGGSDLAGNATLSLAGERPALKAALVSKLLDLADVTGRTGDGDGASGGGSAGGPARVFPDTPLPLEALRAADAEVKLSVERLRIAGIILEAVEAPLVLKDGNLTVDPLAARLAGGPVGGRLAVAAGEAEPGVALTLKGQDIDFGDLLRQAEVSDEVGGALALDIDLKGRGASPHAIAAGLGGHVQAVSQDGTLDNNLLRFFSVGLGDITGPLFGGSDRTRLECFVTRFDIEKGQAKSRALVLDSGAFALAGRGGIDLGAERVSLAFDTQTSQPSLASLAVPFRVTGPLAAPSVVPDPIGAAVGVVGTAGDVAKTGANIVGGAVDAVGGLFGTGPIIGQIGSDQTLCGEALAVLGQNSGADSGTATQPKSSGGLVDDVGDAVKGAGEGIEKGLKSLFGN
ncbi:AsmA family protein [Pelagibius sp. 7325]|uniref:AsmA family protein n=1 Tax=Pelagibius sp. 7325 TaxID=3131994 RepID=UPI0030EBA50F